MPNDHIAFSLFFFPYFFFFHEYFDFEYYYFPYFRYYFLHCKSGRQIQHAWQPPPHAKFKPIL